MATELILPKMGQTMEEGSIVEWLKTEGDEVQPGDVLYTIESDKATLEIEAKARGFLRKILVPSGETVPVLTPVGLLTRTADEPLPVLAGGAELAAGGYARKAYVGRPSGETGQAPARTMVSRSNRSFASPRARMRAAEAGIDLSALRGSGPRNRIVERDVLGFMTSKCRATPVAAKAAQELGVDLATVSGTGRDNRITKADVLAAVGQPVTEPATLAAAPLLAGGEAGAAGDLIRLEGVRRLIAERMSASARQTARVTLVSEVDAAALVRARERLEADVAHSWGFAPGYTDLLGLVVARSLTEMPYMNARLSADGEYIERLAAVNLGIAVDSERGLLVPVIRDSQRKGLRVLGTELRALVERARSGDILPDDLTDGTFTLTNLGMYGVDAFTPVINLPETAILGVGRIEARPIVREGRVEVGQTLTLSLAFDHRLVDGAPAARFLQWVKKAIENPYLLLG